jgi:hypothetical protein
VDLLEDYRIVGPLIVTWRALSADIVPRSPAHPERVTDHGHCPPRTVTDAIKRRLADGLPDAPHDYELDPLIPLGLGGHPTSPNNLWLQSGLEAAAKDREELRLNRRSARAG